jgi:hypothetical protein
MTQISSSHFVIQLLSDRQPRSVCDPTIQISSRFRVSRCWRLAHRPSSDSRYPKCSVSYQWSTTPHDLRAQINSQTRTSRVPTTLTFDFSISRVSKMLISCHVSFPAPMARIDSTLPLANISKFDSSNSWNCYLLSTRTMDDPNEFKTCLMHFPWDPMTVGPRTQI